MCPYSCFLIFITFQLPPCWIKSYFLPVIDFFLLILHGDRNTLTHHTVEINLWTFIITGTNEVLQRNVQIKSDLSVPPLGGFFCIISFIVDSGLESVHTHTIWWARTHTHILGAVCVGSSCGVVGNLVKSGRSRANDAESLQRADRN